MAKHYITVLVVRVLQPAGLLLSIALRPFGLSLIYLLLYLIAPLVPTPTPSTIQGCSGKWLLLNVVVSFLMFMTHAIWHTGVAIFPPYGTLLDSYPIIRDIGRNLGFVSFAKIESYLIFRYLSPEIAICISSLLVYLLSKKLVSSSGPEDRQASSKYRRCPRLVSAGKYLSLLLLMLSGIMRPSITSGLYFLIFMGVATAWAVGKPLERGYAVVGRCVMAIMACHVALLLAYQNTWLTTMYTPDMDMARYFGLTRLITLSNSTNGEEDFTYSIEEDGKWGTLASPLVILLTYFVLALETRELFKPKMLRTGSPSKRWTSVYSRSASRTMHQDSTGSVVVVETDSDEPLKPTMSEEILQAVIDFFDVIIRSSYIATTITMMAWSIIFHSWLSFVFLMWANIVWLMQDQRSFMLKTSPILVSYAMFLLLSQYVYSMNLTADELPDIKEVNLKQIGLSRPSGEPCVPLLIKSLFTCMFWMTLRQWIQEMRQRKQSTLLTDMAAPMQLTVSTAASVLDAQREQETQSRLLNKLGEWLRQLCARYWIYVVAIMLFVIGITGERMTIFRIIYMFLFLAFILMFQISWYWWRRLMYVFWITVIIYSMINLILIYIYQFDNFSKTIETYLLINERLQHDLGLSRYNPADLFVKLLTPTSFLIITIMQVHYFHKDFMELSASKVNISSEPSQVDSSRRSQTGASTIKDDVPPLPLEAEKIASASAEESSFTDAGPSVTTSMRRKASSRARSGVTERSSMTFVDCVKRGVLSFRDELMKWTDKIFLFLEIHLIKIIMLSLMLLCVVNVCAMHVPIMLVICPALLMRPRRQRHIVLFISILISIYFMAKMVYQIDYIKHTIFDVDCPTPTENGTEIVSFNNAEWIGFYKATRQKPLVVLVEGYIALIVLFTFYSLVMYRQKALRKNLVEPRAVRKDRVIFADVSRADADKDLPTCMMYFINYGFYKFGVEVTLMCLMGVIGSRMDLYAVLYAGWLLVLVSISRMKQSFIWATFTGFTTFLVPFQYLLAVGFMPQFCITFPWWGTEKQMINVRNWLFLPYTPDPPHAMKLIFDYFLLLFASRQLRVFSIERQSGDAYPGGSNKEDIGEDWETPSFVNPVPDFLTYMSSWLDVIKRMVFLGMLWVTLAIMFMTGTNRVNLFSMGYLVGSFIFLWQGTDFYLLPKNSILQWWSWLLLYNVSVVAIKTLLQIPGCMFSSIMLEHACWLVQLLGIGCVDKFRGENLLHFFKMEYVKDKNCMVPQEDIGLAWDGVCFAFLILQRRLFRSHYFYRVIDESKATTILASRGAQLIEELRQKQMELQEEQEKKILEKIKVKMERIKANQRKMQIVAKEPRHHDDAEGEPLYKQPSSHQKAVRSGDYYMFDEFDDTDIHEKDDEEESDEDVPKEMGIGKDRHSMTPRSSRTVREADVNLTASEQDMEEFAEPEEFGDTWYGKVRNVLETVWALVQSFLVSLTRYIIKYSRDYRYISRTLTQEKKRLKEREGFGIGLRENSQMRWEPLPDAIVIESKDVTMLEEQDDSLFKHGKSPFVHLFYALWYALLAHTDIVCYIMVFIYQIQSATILSIPLPLMVFLWGTLTIPRPTKTFWVTLIAYTEVIVLIKSMFQFEILPWNQNAIPENMPFTAPRIIGIERKPNYAIYDLLLLLIIFLHRFMLKSLGLWKESAPEIELRDDMEYRLSPEDTQLLVEGQGEEVGRKYIKLHDREGPDTRDSISNKGTSTDEGKVDNAVGDSPERVRRGQSGDKGPEPEPGPSKPTDDDHYQVYGDNEPIIAVTTTIESPYKHFPRILVLSLKRYLRPAERFFRRMTAAGARVTADVYAYMFLCDFFNFLVVIFGFAAFGTHQGDGGVQAYLEENKVPIPFLVMLILQFALIVIDRALYLRKFMLGKILFQYALIIGVHVWMFFVLPFITERTFNALLPPPMWYMLKCIYLLLSAYQIRCGYPRRIIGNFLCKSYRFLNMISFRGFMAVPFVFELRTLMDWIWTDTSMTLVDWLKMEDIFASVYLLKCSRYVEDEFPQPRGVKKSTSSKYLLGGGVLAFVIAIIWFPLVFFAFGNTVGEPNPPKDVTVKIRIGPFLPVYQMSAQSHNIDQFTEQDYGLLSNLYARDRTAQTFLSNYMYNDVAVVTINPNSTMKWMISPPELERLEREAESNSSLGIRFTFVITHDTNAAANPPSIEDHREVQLDAYAGDKRNRERTTLSKLLTNTADKDDWLNVKTLFPKFLKVFNKGTAKPAYQLIPPTEAASGSREYRDVQLRLERQGGAMFWRVREACSNQHTVLSSIPMNDCNMLIMYTFNDKLFPETLNFISGSGIIGLYTTFVFLASRVIRGFFSGIYTKIMFDDLPNVDRVLQLCLDIYLVREAVELTLEEDLFAKLVFLYRSPETMIKWTRPKEEEEQRALPPP